MKATDMLVEEHRIIKKVLQCLDKIVAETEKIGRLNLKAAETAVGFFRDFADGCHHAKEEDLLFPVMEANGFPREGGPTGVMLMEHESGRNFIRAMNESMAKASQGDQGAINQFCENARDYHALLTDHIHKEDHCLFTMADNALSGETKESLLGDFRKIESEAGGKRHEQYIQIARDLCLQYDIEFVGDDQLPVIHSEFILNDA